PQAGASASGVLPAMRDSIARGPVFGAGGAADHRDAISTAALGEHIRPDAGIRDASTEGKAEARQEQQYERRSLDRDGRSVHGDAICVHGQSKQLEPAADHNAAAVRPATAVCPATTDHGAAALASADLHATNTAAGGPSYRFAHSRCAPAL